ncbi:TetR/AcrR family transcriptional regulator [Amycolatopsis pigmentata]|uniref:TetR/AcrR family transcriptional regulator n=1 Tax=Amycolatopsis pigmentata TaxID=450801 RepID=A0ABW5FLJ2_9PSEU
MPDRLSTKLAKTDRRLLVTSGKPSFPTRRAAAARNRDKILSAAWDAFSDPAAEVSMAEIARRAGVGMATLYRNFPGRQELLEALYADEVDALCEAARAEDGQPPGEALTTWLRRLFAFLPGKRLIVSELLELTDQDSPLVHSSRARALAAGRPLLTAAQQAREIRADLTLEQIFDMIAAIAKIHSDPGYLGPMLHTMLDGLRPPT